ncbi:MAG: D-alanyl-D-alanine carboxypeptidase, partial [Gammaproteobacteria bacterium]|nr:D-alanyl-D-alanine carboxypeptidase [Gammaproteobacteria bacterium]
NWKRELENQAQTLNLTQWVGQNSTPIVGHFSKPVCKRLLNAAVNGRIRSKTGLVDHVRSLEGYVTAHSGRRFILIMILNQHDIHRARGARAQDEVLRWLLEHLKM